MVPRKDTSDAHRNAVQAYCHRLLGDTPVVVGSDPVGGPLWSMSRALNEARPRVQTEAMLVTPADYVIRPEVVRRIGAMLDRLPWWGPFRGVWQIPRSTTAAALRRGIELPPRRGMEWWGLCIAATAVRADVWDDVAGMDPRFEGWGPEDAALRKKLIALHGDTEPHEFEADEVWCDRPPPVNNDVTCALYAEEYINIATPEEARAAIARSREPRP